MARSRWTSASASLRRDLRRLGAPEAEIARTAVTSEQLDFLFRMAEPDRRIGFGDFKGQPVWQEVPGEFRNQLRRLIVVQGDAEPATFHLRALPAPQLHLLRPGLRLRSAVGLPEGAAGAQGDEPRHRGQGEPAQPGASPHPLPRDRLACTKR